jgi:uncharacterized protein (DUF1501 family)
LDNGWLARALTQINTNNKHKELGLAVARSLPVSMRGSDHAMTWFPSNLETSNEDFHNRLVQLYEYDERLSKRLEQALEIQELVGNIKHKKKRGQLKKLASSCAIIMSEPSGPDVAMIEMNGWDTHNRQVSRMNSKFKELDQSIKALHDGLANQWQDTLLVIATEFGRTVKINGTGGTDHGTATTLFIAGGSLKGGNVLGEWPGLSKNKLLEERDLRPTSNMFSWIASATAQHFSFSRAQTAKIFPVKT